MTLTITVPESFTAKVRGQDFQVSPQTFAEAGLAKIFEYGLQRIFNDAAASAKTEAEAIELANKRLDNLSKGIIRASGVRQGDPVKRRALELAETAVKANDNFKAWVAKTGLKVSDKAVVAKMRELAAKAVAVDGNKYTAQARIDVEAAKGLGDMDLEIDLDE
jgi:hypothetical protein